MPLLDASGVRRRLAGVPGWRRVGKTLVREYRFDRYLDGIRFVNRVAKLAEKQNHHPDIGVRWCRVALELTTHDEGGLTGRDFRLAKAIGRIAR